MLDDARHLAAKELAQNALRLAEQHEIAPIPCVFEVLVAHLSGENDAVSAKVEAALQAPVDERERAIRRIYYDNLGNAALQDALERVRDGLSSEISEVTDRLSDGMRGNLQLADELRKSLRELAGSVTREELQLMVKHVVLQSRTHLNDTQSVTQQLERTQFQLDQMERELSALREAASKDHLTRLPNRQYLEEKLSALLSSPQPLCFALIDLDRFKSVNDTWGHAVGDNILRGIGQVLHENTKGRDFAARVGGEEFAIVLPNTPLQGAITLCETIRAAFEEILWISDSTEEEIGHFTLSCGVTERIDTDNAMSLFERADKLLYQAKNGGRNQVCSDDPN